MDLSIIIVNWNSSQYLENCLKSIIDNPCRFSFEVIVVDNASYDGCVKVVEKYSKIAILVQSNSNLGFARANNLGYHHSKGRSLLFLNPDTEIFGDALNKMHDALLSILDIGGLGCKVINTDGSVQTSCIQAFPTITNQLLDADCIRNLYPRSRLWGMRPLFEAGDHAFEVEAIAGSCFMVRREAFERVGLFSEDYFMYAEDIDLSYKLRLQGYKNYYAGFASIIHHGGGSTKNSKNGSFSAVIMRDSVDKYFLKNHGSCYHLLYIFMMQIVSAVRLSMLFIMYLLAVFGLGDKEQVKSSLNKWKSIFLWSIGGENWVREY
jgi:hypothetical protein